LKITLACCALLLRGQGATMPGHATSARLDDMLTQGAAPTLPGSEA